MKNLIWSETFSRKIKPLLRQNPQLRFIFRFITQPNSEENDILLLTIGSDDQVY